jgi:uncharacterized protein (TIGR03084 family)
VTASLSTDLRAEGNALHALLDAHSGGLAAVTPFQGWRVTDVVAHLRFVDRIAELTLTDDAEYRREQAQFAAAMAGAAAGETYGRMAAYERDHVEPGDAARLVAAWHGGLNALGDRLDASDPGRVVDWFGRPMKAGRLAAARQMEIWAYGQDAYDAFRVRRRTGDRLRQVADFGVRTMRFSFANRGLEPPAPPYVRLVSDSGQAWTWNDPHAPTWVEGPAEDFCLVVTQRRHLVDTALRVTGAMARQWMMIAQTIAGPPQDGPPPGLRAW